MRMHQRGGKRIKDRLSSIYDFAFDMFAFDDFLPEIQVLLKEGFPDA